VDTAERWNAPIAVWLLICLALAYVPDMGHGFIADDFGWILHSRVRGPGDLARLFTTAPMGFYRPVVSLSFLLNEPMAGLTSIAYGLVNLALVLAVAGAIVTLCQVLGLGGGYGLFAAGVWTFNIHGVGMALTWISGRTSLLATLFAVLAAIAFTRQRRGMAGLWTGLAVLSKEEPILLPMVFIVWTAVERQRAGDAWLASLLAGVRQTWHCLAAVVVYLALRSVSGALTPWNAPDYYRLSLSPSVLGPNVLEYADRAATFGAAVLVLGLLLFVRRPPRLSLIDSVERGIIVRGLVWLVFGYGLTVMVPVRSDLYACLPSVGVAVIAGAGGRALWRHVPTARQPAAIAALLLLPLLLLPVYRGRNVFARNDAALSTTVVRRVVAALRDRDDLTRVEVYQHAGEKPSIASALGGNLTAAIALGTGRQLDAEVHLTSPGDRWPAPTAHTLRLTVVGDEIVAVMPPQ